MFTDRTIKAMLQYFCFKKQNLHKDDRMSYTLKRYLRLMQKQKLSTDKTRVTLLKIILRICRE